MHVEQKSEPSSVAQSTFLSNITRFRHVSVQYTCTYNAAAAWLKDYNKNIVLPVSLASIMTKSRCVLFPLRSVSVRFEFIFQKNDRSIEKQ